MMYEEKFWQPRIFPGLIIALNTLRCEPVLATNKAAKNWCDAYRKLAGVWNPKPLLQLTTPDSDAEVHNKTILATKNHSIAYPTPPRRDE